MYCRHLLACRTLVYYPSDPDDGQPDARYYLGQVLVNVRNPDGGDAPFVVPRLFAYFQLFGEAGDYDLGVVLAVVTADEYGSETTRDIAEWGPRLVPVTGLDLVEAHGFPLDDVPFDGPGVYEFQLWSDGSDDPLAAERVAVPTTAEERS